MRSYLRSQRCLGAVLRAEQQSRVLGGAGGRKRVSGRLSEYNGSQYKSGGSVFDSRLLKAKRFYFPKRA